MADLQLSAIQMMIKQGLFEEAERSLKSLVENIPIGWKPQIVSDNLITIAFWDQKEFLWHSTHHKETPKSNVLVEWISPSYSKAYYLLSYIEIEKGNLELAVNYLDSALELEPNHPELICEKATILQSLGNIDEALDLYISAATIRSWLPPYQRARAYRGASVLLMDAGQLERAGLFLQAAIELDPRSPDNDREMKYLQGLLQGNTNIETQILSIED
jgi:tetratricopeptide (TPR) repeat protein